MAAVLASRDLVLLIASFQDGLPQSLLATHMHLRHVDKLQLHRLRPQAITINVMDYVAATGQFLALLFLHARGYTCSVWAMNAAAEHGHIAIVRFLHDHRHEGCTVHAMDAAAKHGHLDVLEFLHYHRHEGCTALALNAACANGHKDVVAFLHTHRSEGGTAQAMDGAAAHGHLGIVQLLHATRHEGCTDRAIEDAAMHGHFEVVRFLHCHRTEGNVARALRNAAANGHDKIVAFLLPLVAAVPPDAMDFAARNGEMETLRVLHAAGAPCTKRALTWAAMAGHGHVVAFLMQYRTEGDANEALAMATRMGMDQVAALLRVASTATSPVVSTDVDYLGFSMSKKRAPSCPATV
ncbi:hypothetical protein SDRG_04492 [Saprolegnia diclina VS20]|uniref:Uncharacterized protein n=1 Tax=Saprolegnia diclina (strain VS20) TaxID=1156394 RepID=T0S5U5_SAPDV|nr:hypothetical protein SDRG_04492 [Saprolegnia diclina VS20]EQC38062.1 hypothetical protein SDRG_04492 [Saprolegnia diclina VS20]|eukprot:XP_008608389.1 hypothetical protein SDRG_04492 [Saprolegnia diclina VS20]